MLPNETRPLIAITLVTASPRLPGGRYSAARQLTVNDEGDALLGRPPIRARSGRPQPPRTITRVVAEPADISGFAPRPNRPPTPPRTITHVIQEPADVARSARRFTNPRLEDPLGDNVITGTVSF